MHNVIFSPREIEVTLEFNFCIRSLNDRDSAVSDYSWEDLCAWLTGSLNHRWRTTNLIILLGSFKNTIFQPRDSIHFILTGANCLSKPRMCWVTVSASWWDLVMPADSISTKEGPDCTGRQSQHHSRSQWQQWPPETILPPEPQPQLGRNLEEQLLELQWVSDHLSLGPIYTWRNNNQRLNPASTQRNFQGSHCPQLNQLEKEGPLMHRLHLYWLDKRWVDIRVRIHSKTQRATQHHQKLVDRQQQDLNIPTQMNQKKMSLKRTL